MLANTFGKNEVLESELTGLQSSFRDRDETIGSGIVIAAQHYDVHRFHDKEDLIYGRRGVPGEGAGFCLLRRKQKKTQKYFYFFITHLPPTISAKTIPILILFADRIIEQL